jgi:hypothetical protein
MQRIRKKDLLEKRFPFPGRGIDFDDLARLVRAGANHRSHPQLADNSWQRN